MIWPERITQEEMDILRKEWVLSGGKVHETRFGIAFPEYHEIYEDWFCDGVSYQLTPGGDWQREGRAGDTFSVCASICSTSCKKVKDGVAQGGT